MWKKTEHLRIFRKFQGIECSYPKDTSKEDLSKLQSNLEIKQIHMTAESGSHFGYAALVGREKDFLDSAKKAIEYCEALDCKL